MPSRPMAFPHGEGLKFEIPRFDSASIQPPGIDFCPDGGVCSFGRSCQNALTTLAVCGQQLGDGNTL